jgi:threonylcarbamoyladenosine tRNA methylthiotransferase MtaB
MGCRLNTFESQVIRDAAGAAGLTNAVIINTCAVTAESERQARQTIRRARRDHPRARLIVTGCAAQLDPRAYADMPEVDQVLGNREKLDAKSYLAAEEPARVEVADIMTVRDTAPHLISGFEERTRAFVQIQQGCDHRCTFCIIPFARGNNQSLGLGRIVEQVRKLVDGGYREVVLTGVDICSYGSDLPGRTGLGDMTRRLLKAVPELPRLRLSSLDPAAMDNELFELLASEPRLMPHLHLSLQSLDDMVLKRMKRRHSVDDAMRVIERARQACPDVALGADLIAGFPTETDAMHANTLRLVRELNLVHLHVFPYSERPGTPAARMPVEPRAIRKQRARELRAAGNQSLKRHLDSRAGSTAEVLVEKDGYGLCRHYLPVELNFPTETGSIVRTQITGVADGRLLGSAAV